MSLSGMIYAIGIFGLTGASFALPTVVVDQIVVVPADTIDKYTFEYFVDAARYIPPPASCIVYTARLTQKAQAYAVKNAMYTIWDVWDCQLYDRSQVASNPLRDILAPTPYGTNSPDTQKYFENMSDAYVALCDAYALLMTDTLPTINERGIWGRIEKPRMQRTKNPGGQVDLIDACDENASKCLDPPYWQRSPSSSFSSSELRSVRGNKIMSSTSNNLRTQQERKGSISRNNDRVKRDQMPALCYDPKQLGEIFADIDELW